MPQWDFLNFLAKKAVRYPGFGLLMKAEVTGLIEESGRVVGVRANTATDRFKLTAGTSTNTFDTSSTGTGKAS